MSFVLAMAHDLKTSLRFWLLSDSLSQPTTSLKVSPAHTPDESRSPTELCTASLCYVWLQCPGRRRLLSMSNHYEAPTNICVAFIIIQRFYDLQYYKF